MSNIVDLRVTFFPIFFRSIHFLIPQSFICISRNDTFVFDVFGFLFYSQRGFLLPSCNADFQRYLNTGKFGVTSLEARRQSSMIKCRSSEFEMLPKVTRLIPTKAEVRKSNLSCAVERLMEPEEFRNMSFTRRQVNGTAMKN